MKKIPLRMCISCREMQPKSNLIRIVKTKENEVLIDNSKKIDGRGAYVCKNEQCIATIEKKKTLNRAFKMNLDKEIYDKLKALK